MLQSKKTNEKMSNFYTRLISTIILLPPVLYAICAGGLLYFLLLFILVIIVGYEWNNICGKWSFALDAMFMITFMMLSMLSFYMNYVLVGLLLIFLGGYGTYFLAKVRAKSEVKAVIPHFLNRSLWLSWGSVYLAFGLSSMAYLNNFHIYTIIWVFLGTVFNDTFAYISGSLLKSKKIAPKISPGKSWGGFLGACMSTMFLSYFFAIALGTNNEIFLMIVGLFMAFFAHLGDFIESGFKRYVGIKDTSNIIPGHGGILDRIDALLLVALYIAILCFILGQTPLTYNF